MVEIAAASRRVTLALSASLLLCGQTALGVQPHGPHPAAREVRPLGAPSGESVRPLGPQPSDEKTPADLAGAALRTLIPLAVVLGLIGGLFFVARRIARTGGGLSAAVGAGGRAPSGLVSVLGRYPISGGQTLVLLQVDRRILLVAMSHGSSLRGRPGSMRTLCEIDEPEEVASILMKARDERGESIAQRFRALMQRFERESPSEPDDRRLGSGEWAREAPVRDEPTADEPAAGARSPLGALRARLEAYRGLDTPGARA